MISAPRAAIEERAERWRSALALPAGAGAGVEWSQSMIGGGSLPGESLPTAVLALRGPALDTARFAARLRRGDPPVVARLAHDAVLLDPRTVAAEDDEALVAALGAALDAAAG